VSGISFTDSERIPNLAVKKIPDTSSFPPVEDNLRPAVLAFGSGYDVHRSVNVS
jgi:hypothetical protein